MNGRFKAIIEVILVFVLLSVVNVITYYFPFPVITEQFASYSLLAVFFIFAALIILVLLIVTKRNFVRYGLTLKNLNGSLKIAAICIVAVLIIRLLCYTPVVMNPVWWIALSALFVVMLLAVAVILARYPGVNKVQTPSLLMFAPALLLLSIPEKAAAITAFFLFAFLLLGPVEELIFRGYIQSRLNDAFGRPYRFFGVSFGTGMIITSFLFWIWHFWSPLNPLFSFFGGNALTSVWIFFAGLTYGYIREKSGDIVAPALVHSAFDFPLYIVMVLSL